MPHKTKDSLFRKVAASLWHDQGDPSVYGFVEVDVTELPEASSNLLALVTKALGMTMQNNIELRSMMHWGAVAYREDHCISIMVNIPDAKKDLSILNIHHPEALSIEEIKKQIDSKAILVRKREDPHLGPILGLLSYVPKSLLKIFLKLYAISIYDLKLKLQSKYFPHRPFGSVIISNVGSLGIKKALLPLVPLARPALMLSVGKIDDEVKAYQGKISIRKMVHLGITFDHRLFDGSHAAKMLNDFEKSFYSLITS